MPAEISRDPGIPNKQQQPMLKKRRLKAAMTKMHETDAVQRQPWLTWLQLSQVGKWYVVAMHNDNSTTKASLLTLLKRLVSCGFSIRFLLAFCSFSAPVRAILDCSPSGRILPSCSLHHRPFALYTCFEVLHHPSVQHSTFAWLSRLVGLVPFPASGRHTAPRPTCHQPGPLVNGETHSTGAADLHLGEIPCLGGGKPHLKADEALRFEQSLPSCQIALASSEQGGRGASDRPLSCSRYAWTSYTWAQTAVCRAGCHRHLRNQVSPVARCYSTSARPSHLSSLCGA